MNRLVVLMLIAACATPAAVEDTAPDENDADARGAEHEQLAQQLEKNPDSPKILLRLAELEATQGRVDEHKAAERKTIASEAKARGNATVNEAQLAEAQRLETESAQQRAQAAQHYETFAKKFASDPSAPLALFSLAEVERALHHDDRADAALERILHDYPSSSIAYDAHLMRAEQLFVANDMAQAVKEYDAAAKGERQRAYATYKRAWCQLNLEHFDLALNDFQAAMVGAPGKLANEAAKDWVRTWAMVKGSTPAGAKERLEKFAHPGTVQALMKRLAQTYKDLGRDAEATEAERLAQ